MEENSSKPQPEEAMEATLATASAAEEQSTELEQPTAAPAAAAETAPAETSEPAPETEPTSEAAPEVEPTPEAASEVEPATEAATEAASEATTEPASEEESTSEAASETEPTPEAAAVAAPAAESSSAVASEPAAEPTAEAASEAANGTGPEAKPVESAPKIATKSAEELHVMPFVDLLDYLKELTQANSARQVMKAVGEVKSEYHIRREARVKAAQLAASDATTPEAAAEGVVPSSEAASGENTAEAEQPTVEQTEEEKSFEALLESYDKALIREREELHKKQQSNAAVKQGLIERLSALVEDTTVNPSAQLADVKEIIKKWKETGQVPSDQKEINSTFHTLTDKFFGKLNIDRELRDLDMRHNLTEKQRLCEEAEGLSEEPSIQRAFAHVQRLHAAWKALGPVPQSERESIWERFKAATNAVSKRFKEQAELDVVKEKENYEKKLKLCEDAEAIAGEPNEGVKAVDQKTQRIMELQKVWRTIGFAPREVRDEVYARFRKACDQVFDDKRAFFKAQNARYAENMKLKVALCEKAEAVMNSTDWKSTANLLINLQKEWKTVGPVAQKQSDAVWKRFRKACDTFFDNRQAQSDGETAAMQDNLVKKQAIIEELKTLTPPADADAYLKLLQGLMQRWNTIGFVPGKDKQEVNTSYAELLDKHFAALKLDRPDGELERFRGRMGAMAADSQGRDRVAKERNRLQAQIRQAEQDIQTLETNITFLAKSKNSESIVATVNERIKRTKEDIAQLNKKLAILNEV